MNILITGEPHSGKSTLLAQVVSGFENKQGFITQEILECGGRTGFEIISEVGDRTILASVSSPSEQRVSRYGVEVANLGKFVAGLQHPREGTLLYVDEIGQMQLFSEPFKQYVTNCLNSPNLFLATLTSVYKDSFTEKLKARDDIEVVELTVDNRNVIRQQIADKVSKLVR